MSAKNFGIRAWLKIKIEEYNAMLKKALAEDNAASQAYCIGKIVAYEEVMGLLTISGLKEEKDESTKMDKTHSC